MIRLETVEPDPNYTDCWTWPKLQRRLLVSVDRTLETVAMTQLQPDPSATWSVYEKTCM